LWLSCGQEYELVGKVAFLQIVWVECLSLICPEFTCLALDNYRAHELRACALESHDLPVICLCYVGFRGKEYAALVDSQNTANTISPPCSKIPHQPRSYRGTVGNIKVCNGNVKD